MKKYGILTALFLILALMIAPCGGAHARAEGQYRLGDVMDDFFVALADGTETSLSALLKEKQMVLINLWASWCGPCCREFPEMQAAYDRFSDRVAVLALSVENGDTNEKILQFKEDNGLTTLPMGRDVGLAARFGVQAIPTTVVVDRSGVICWIHIGSMSDFERIFEEYTADDYREPRVYDSAVIPGMAYHGEMPAPEALDAALNVSGGEMHFVNGDGRQSWPFLISADGGVVNSNGRAEQELCALSARFSAQAGDAVTVECRVACDSDGDYFFVQLDGVPVQAIMDNRDWQTLCVPIEQAGEHEIAFCFFNAEVGGRGDKAQLKNAALLTGSAAQAARAAEPVWPRALSGKQAAIRANAPARRVQISDPNGSWERIYGNVALYLAEPGTLLTYRIEIGEDVNPKVALFYDADGQRAFLNEMTCTEQGFTGVLEVKEKEMDFEFVNVCALYADIFDRSQSVSEMLVFASAAELDHFVSVELPELGIPQGAAWQLAEEEGSALYALRFTDAAGQPVAGVMAQICDENTCEVMFSGSDGMVTFEKARFPYEIHVLSVPEGFNKPSAAWQLPESGNADAPLTITLTTK